MLCLFIRKSFLVHLLYISCLILELLTKPHVLYTPQKNVVAERKNHHLLEVTRTLLIDMNVLKYFYEDAVLTACYLINRCLLEFLMVIYHNIFFIPNMTCFLSPRIFDCVCFVRDHNTNHIKLDPKAFKCVIFWIF